MLQPQISAKKKKQFKFNFKVTWQKTCVMISTKHKDERVTKQKRGKENLKPKLLTALTV